VPSPISDLDPEPVTTIYSRPITAKRQTVLLLALQQSWRWSASQQKALSIGRTASLQHNIDQPAPNMDVDVTSPDEVARAKARLEAIQEIEDFESSVLAHLPSNARSLCPHDHTPALS
jgi:hypothetical protein